VTYNEKGCADELETAVTALNENSKSLHEKSKREIQHI
jgi:hypothetical protein